MTQGDGADNTGTPPDSSERLSSRSAVNAFHYLLQMGAGSLLPLATLPIVTHALGPAEVGLFALALTWSTVTMSLATFGTLLGYERTYFLHEGDREASSDLLVTAWIAASAAMALTWLAVFVADADLSRVLLGETAGGNLLLTVLAARGLSRSSGYYLAYLKNHGDALTYSRVALVEPAVNAVGILYWVGYVQAGVSGLAFAALGAGVAQWIIALVGQLRLGLGRPRWGMLREIASVAIPLSPRTLVGAIGGHFDKVMLGMLGDMGALGVYSIAQRLAYAVFVFMTALDRVFQPELYRRLFRGDRLRGTGDFLVPYAYISTLAALMTLLFSEEAFALLMPPEYGAGVDLVAVLALYYALLFLGKVASTQLIFAKRALWTSGISVVAVVLNVAFNVPLISAFGAMGAAVATLAAGCVSQAALATAARRCARIDWRVGRVASMYGVLLLSSLAVLSSRSLIYDAWQLRLLMRLALLAGYLWLGRSIGLVTWARLRGLWTSSTEAMRDQVSVRR